MINPILRPGSRLRLWVCRCDPPVRLRAARDDMRVYCGECRTPFTKVEVSPTAKRPRKATA